MLEFCAVCHSVAVQHTSLSHAYQPYNCSLPDTRLKHTYFRNVLQSNADVNRRLTVNIDTAGRMRNEYGPSSYILL